jgi:hypothetical protein
MLKNQRKDTYKAHGWASAPLDRLRRRETPQFSQVANATNWAILYANCCVN